jgi:ComF family protein
MNVSGTAFRPAQAVFHGLISLVIPDDCRLCGHPLREASRIPVCPQCLASAAHPMEAEYLCGRCRSPFLNRESLNDAGMCPACEAEPQGFDSAWSYGAYDGALRRLIHVFKYERVDTLAGPLAGMLLDALPRDEEFDCVAPMPLHWRKQWDRGFNQAELLAREVARRVGIPYSDLLKRGKASPAQAGLTFAARRDNVQGAFAIRRKAAARDRHVLLIDDVLTTGATAAAAARVLKRAGKARRISILTLARADRRYAWRSTAGLASGAGGR